MSNIAFLPGSVPCEICGSDLARHELERYWLCTTCFDVLSAKPTPAPPPIEVQQRLEETLRKLLDPRLGPDRSSIH